MKDLRGISPAGLVRARAHAFGEGNFGLIYDTYHGDSHFRQQFPERDAYIHYGKANLSSDFSIRQCMVIREEIIESEAHVIFYLETVYRGTRSESFELSLFYREEGEWRYHSSQKMDRADYDGAVADLAKADFEKVKDKVYF
nr:YchJ family metal-binding protein [Desulfuromonas sp. AOP6]